MTTAKNNIQLPYLEDTELDGKKLYIPKEWTERLRHYIKRIYDIDIKPALSGETIPTSSRWTEGEPEIRQDLIWGAGPSAIENITKGEFNTDPDTINTERLLQLFKDYYMPKRNTYYSRGDFFWAKQEENETPEEHWRKLVSFEKKRNSRTSNKNTCLSQNSSPVIPIKNYGKTHPRENTEYQSNNGLSNPRQLRETTQTMHDTYSTRKRERSKTGTNTENTQKFPSKQKHTYRKTNTKEKRLRILRTTTGHHHIDAQQRRQSATLATNWDTLQEYAARIPKT